MAEKPYDALVIGAGIGGAGMAAALSPHMSVMLLETEDHPGYHTTGRSAAFYAESYGGPAIQPLTTASGGFLYHPPTGFADTPLITERGAIHIFGGHQQAAADAMLEELQGIKGATLIDADAVRDAAPDVRWPDLMGAVTDPACGDLDVAGLHQAYLRVAKANGTDIRPRTKFLKAERVGSAWQVETSGGSVTADIVINAAGAWGDEVAEAAGVKPIGLTPLRRTALTINAPEGAVAKRTAPVVLDIEETCYFRPEGAGFLISPADETPMPPSDCQADELDVAIAVDRFQTYTGLEVRHLVSRWAGLRTFAPDRLPVIGFDDQLPGFFWTVGQGGWGIQTSPAWSALAAKLVLGAPADLLPLPDIDPTPYGVSRLR